MKAVSSKMTQAVWTRIVGNWRWLSGLAAAVVSLGLSPVMAAPIPVPNGSFESQVAPQTYPYVTTLIDSWQKAPKPAWFDEATFGVLWDQTAGLFQNTPVGMANHIDNMDGNQGLYMFTFPQVGLFQDYSTVDWNDPAPTHAFNSTFQLGMSYQLTVGVIGGLGGMTDGAGLQLSLYYRDAGNNLVTVGATPITYTTGSFPNANQFTDFSVTIPAVQAGDAWAGQNIGIGIVTTSGTGAGYWDLDNVRLTVIPEPGSAALLGIGLGAFFLRRLRRGSARRLLGERSLLDGGTRG